MLKYGKSTIVCVTKRDEVFNIIIYTYKNKLCTKMQHTRNINFVTHITALITRASARRGTNTPDPRHFLMYKINLSL